MVNCAGTSLPKAPANAYALDPMNLGSVCLRIHPQEQALDVALNLCSSRCPTDIGVLKSLRLATASSLNSSHNLIHRVMNELLT